MVSFVEGNRPVTNGEAVNVRASSHHSSLQGSLYSISHWPGQLLVYARIPHGTNTVKTVGGSPSLKFILDVRPADT